jgi:anti-sigma regulatory factor (Ser/Thr protein kinase)
MPSPHHHEPAAEQRRPARTRAAGRTHEHRDRAPRRRGFCGGQAFDHQAVAITISEAVTNAVVHAYPAGVDGGIRLVATLHPGSLVVEVSDRGRGMTPAADSPGMGIGLGLIARLSDGFEIQDGRSGTTLTMRFDLGA